MASRSPGTREAASRSPLAFFALLFALSVPFWVAGAIVANPAGLPMGLPVSAFQFVLPLVVACVLVYRRERWSGITALIRRTLSPRGSTRRAWWIPVVALVPAMMAATYAVMRLAGTAPRGSHSPLSAIPVLLIMYAVAAGCEEAGWMGYVFPPLRQRLGPLAAGLLVGVVWAVWHLVGFVQADRSALWIVGQCLSTVAIRVLMVWLFDVTGGIVLSAIIVHTLVNVTQSLFPGFTQRPAPAVVLGVVSMLVVAASITWRQVHERKQRRLRQVAGVRGGWKVGGK